jgi:hypothetical protein
MRKTKASLFLFSMAAVVALLFLPGVVLGQTPGKATPAKAPSKAAATDVLVGENLAPHPAPVQPIAYSHKTHLALGLQCKTCHTNPEPGKLMTFPATSTCMQCHAGIATDKPSIQKLTEFSKSNAPIPWVRVYTVLPGVTWNHRIHLQAGVGCATCHGAVAQMATMSETTTVTTMAACINCHRAKSAPTSCVTCHAWPAASAVLEPERSNHSH